LSVNTCFHVRFFNIAHAWALILRRALRAEGVASPLSADSFAALAPAFLPELLPDLRHLPGVILVDRFDVFDVL
jgi:hypothetical protein